MSGTRGGRHFAGQEKVAILRRHLVEKVPVSDLCEEHGIHPTLFYRWQKDWFEQGAVVFDAPRGRNGSAKRSEDAAAQRITALQEKLRRKDEVLSELMGGARGVKKKSWGSLKATWVPHDTRDTIVDFVGDWSEGTEIPATRLVKWIGIASRQYH